MKKFILSVCLTALTAATVFANPTPEEVRQIFQLPITELTPSTTFADMEGLRSKLQELSKLHSSEAEFLKKFELGYPRLYPKYRKYINDTEALKFFSQKDGRIKRFIKGTLGFIKRHKIISFITFTTLLAYTVYSAACLCTTLYPQVYAAYAGYLNSQPGGDTSTAYTKPLLASWEALEKDPNTAAQAMCVKLAHKILGAYASCDTILEPYIKLITEATPYKWAKETAVPYIRASYTAIANKTAPIAQAIYDVVVPEFRAGINKIIHWGANTHRYLNTFSQARPVTCSVPLGNGNDCVDFTLKEIEKLVETIR